MSERRKLGENDPGRYEISILIGPCSLLDAEVLLDDIAAAVEDAHGASVTLSTWDEDDAA